MFRSFKEKPDIIILDYRMPIKNGIDALKEILQIDNNSRIIFASADKTIKEEVYSYGAIEFLDKPFTVEPLAWAIRKNDPDFLKWLNKFLTEIKEDGRYEKIHHKWFKSKDWIKYVQ